MEKVTLELVSAIPRYKGLYDMHCPPLIFSLLVSRDERSGQDIRSGFAGIFWGNIEVQVSTLQLQ
jgi:hypothetical protein